MNLDELKDIIRHLKKTVPCSRCNKKFINEEIQVLSTYNTEALMHFNCQKCFNQLLIHVTIVEQTENNNIINIRKHKANAVNQNDVLDIHNFLNQFKGDFKNLFST